MRRATANTTELDGFTGEINDIFRSILTQSDGGRMAGMKTGTEF